MKITRNTLFFAVEPILRRLSAEQLAPIKAAAPALILGEGGYLNITIGQLSQLIDANNIGALVAHTEVQTMTVFEYYTIEGLHVFLSDYTNKLETLTPVPDANEKRAAAACLKTTITEGMLYFAREYFGLHSFAEAEKITLAEVLLAKKDVYNKVVFQRAYTRIMNKKGK